MKHHWALCSYQILSERSLSFAADCWHLSWVLTYGEGQKRCSGTLAILQTSELTHGTYKYDYLQDVTVSSCGLRSNQLHEIKKAAITHLCASMNHFRLITLKPQYKKQICTMEKLSPSQGHMETNRRNNLTNTWWQFKVTNAFGLWMKTSGDGNPSIDKTSKLHPGRLVTILRPSFWEVRALNTVPPCTITCLNLLQVVL